jgi:Mg2+-importing ATPase
MIELGALSLAFDRLTVAALLGVFHASPELFRTGWFVASLLTERVVSRIVRTRRPFYRSRPGRVLRTSTLVLAPVAYIVPFIPFAHPTRTRCVATGPLR